MHASLVSFEPATSHKEAIERAARVWGIQTEYWDIWGKRHVAGQDALASILRSLGVDSGSREQLNLAMEERLWQEWSELAPAAAVIEESAGNLSICVPDSHKNAQVEGEFLWEQGGRIRFTHAAGSLETSANAALRGEIFLKKRLPLPPGPPLGYHKLRIVLRAGRSIVAQSESRLIVCPARAYLPEELAGGKRMGGVSVSLYGIRSERNWGCGDFNDLCSFIDWAAEDADASFVGLNPLHAIPNRQPYNTSPYLPTSVLYRNPLYLDVESVEDVKASERVRTILAGPGLRGCIERLRAAEFVEYEKIWALKKRVLKAAFRRFHADELKQNTARAREFLEFERTEGEALERFALYQALDDSIHAHNPDVWIWPDWPREFKDPDSEAVKRFALEHPRAILFHKYLQWQVDRQLGAVHQYAREKGMKIGLYHDLALATDRCGGDLWTYRDFFVKGARVGSPPDDFSPAGQDWAFPPPNAGRHRADGYRLFAESIRKNARHGGALRIDHVMRFFRLFWIPEGKDAAQGTYVLDHAEELLRILALESVRNQVVIVGEDLGTVEPEVRAALERAGVLSYRLLYFEKTPVGGYKRPEEYPSQALVAASTHDLPTLAGFWENRDIEARKEARLLTSAAYREQLKTRAAEKQKLLDLFHASGLLPAHAAREATAAPEFSGDLHNAAIGFLTGANAMLLALNQEDIFKDADQQNLPGSTEQYPNWRHKMRFTVEQLRSDRFARDCTHMFRDWLRRGGRANSAL